MIVVPSSAPPHAVPAASANVATAPTIVPPPTPISAPAAAIAPAVVPVAPSAAMAMAQPAPVVQPDAAAASAYSMTPHLSPPQPSTQLPSVGSAALFAEYQRCLASLEGAINGGLQRRRSTLVEAASAVERNIESLRVATDAVQRESEEDATAIAERLHAKRQHKLSMLQHDLSAYLIDVDAIDSFISQVLSHAADPPDGVSAAQHAKALIDRQHELLGRAQRLTQRPFAPPTSVPVDDLPREVATRAAQLGRLESLEKLLRVKDEIVAELVETAAERSQQRDEQQAHAARAHAFAQAVQATAHEELVHWSGVAEASAQRVESLTGELDATRHEAAELRGQNEQLREQNAMLRAHIDELRTMVVRSTSGHELGAGVVAA
jgi:hypothetical protein